MKFSTVLVLDSIFFLSILYSTKDTYYNFGKFPSVLLDIPIHIEV